MFQGTFCPQNFVTFQLKKGMLALIKSKTCDTIFVIRNIEICLFAYIQGKTGILKSSLKVFTDLMIVSQSVAIQILHTGDTKPLNVCGQQFRYQNGQKRKEKKKYISCVTCLVSGVTCHVSHVTCHMSCVMCLVSRVTCHMSPVTKGRV